MEEVPSKLKTPMTSAERSRNYRERLKAREDYDQIKDINVKRGQLYRLNKQENMTEEEKAEVRAKTKERVRKHREKKKAEGGDISTGNTKILTRKQKEELTVKNRERKRKERSNWTPQKWRRHREKCRERYHSNKPSAAPEPSSITDENSVDAGCSSWTPRSRQRAVKKVLDNLPQSKEKQQIVVQHVLQTIGSVINLDPISEEQTEDVIKVDRLTKRKLAQMALKTKLQSNRRKLKNTMKTFNLSSTYLHRVKRMSNPNILRRKSLSTLKRHKEVRAFYILPQYATELSEKKKIRMRSKQPTMVLKETLSTIYDQYKLKVDNPVCLSLFKSLRPKNVKLAKTEKLNQCLCEVCQNMQLKLQAVNPHLAQEKRLRSLYDVILSMLCSTDAAFHDLKCLRLQCEDCGIKKLDNFLQIDEAVTSISWSKWVLCKVNKKKIITRTTEPLQNFKAEMLKEARDLPLHLFNARWQHKEFVDVKSNPGLNTCISVMDFAENYRCILQDEIQSAHWSYVQVTLHPVVNYYPCGDCNKTITDVVAIVSDDNTHDTHAVALFADRVFEHLADKAYFFRRIIQWSDNCGSQYKCKNAFRDLHALKKFAPHVERHFFGSRHGKNACDGESAVIKRTVSQAVKDRRVVVQSAADFFAYCKIQLVKPDYLDGACQHYRRDFIFIKSEDIKRNKQNELVTLQGTRALHSIRSIGPLELQTRPISCFCHGCQNGTECFNQSHVDPWQSVTMRTKAKAGDDEAVSTTQLETVDLAGDPLSNVQVAGTLTAEQLEEDKENGLLKNVIDTDDEGAATFSTSETVWDDFHSNVGNNVGEQNSADGQVWLESLVQETCNELVDRNIFEGLI